MNLLPNHHTLNLIHYQISKLWLERLKKIPLFAISLNSLIQALLVFVMLIKYIHFIRKLNREK